MTAPLIVALDFNQRSEALNLVDKLDPNDCALKVGNEMFTLLGSTFVKILIKRNFRVFLDLKFHDIPNTVARACAVSAEMGIWMLNLHASGGLAMMRAAYNALEAFGAQKPLLIAVTVLTSMHNLQLVEVGVDDSIPNQVNRLAKLAQTAGLDGIVCSALEVPVIKQQFGQSFLTVTPGIRLIGDEAFDQSRIVTPKDALMMGSDYLVVGRSITKAFDPASVVRKIINSIN